MKVSSIVERLRAQAAARPRRVLLPESHDPRVIEAAALLAINKLATPILLSRPPVPIRGLESFPELPENEQWEKRVDETLERLLAQKGKPEIEARSEEHT